MVSSTSISTVPAVNIAICTICRTSALALRPKRSSRLIWFIVSASMSSLPIR